MPFMFSNLTRVIATYIVTYEHVYIHMFIYVYIYILNSYSLHVNIKYSHIFRSSTVYKQLNSVKCVYHPSLL